MSERHSQPLRILQCSISHLTIVQVQHNCYVHAKESLLQSISMTTKAKVLNAQSLFEECAGRLQRWLIDQKHRYEHWRLIKTTQAELERLSDRELADLGLDRFEIKRVLRQATASWHRVANTE